MHHFNFFLFFFCVVPKTPEGKRAFPEQVEGWIISILEDRTRERGKVLR